MEITAPLSAILAGERTFLNLACHLSGVATLTHRYVQAVKGSGAKILDTRKTTPLWRDLEKYAVTCGGGYNHRNALSDAILVKDNHVEAVRASGGALIDFYGKKQLASVRKKLKFVEIEAKTLPEVMEAVACQPDVILLDNMSLARLKKSIVLIKKTSRKILIEVSGGITLQKAKRLARLGVDRISVGALTHSAPVLDISLEVV
jgi:nicotinate-nucleotide pyrophosphorylase (carboxylating)